MGSLRSSNLQAAIGQLSEAAVEVDVDGPGVDQLVVAEPFADVKEVHSQLDLDVGMVEDAAEHGRVAVGRHRLVLVGEVAIIGIGAMGMRDVTEACNSEGSRCHCLRV